jgi:hypothetical protein
VVPTNWERLGLTLAEKDDWLARRTAWLANEVLYDGNTTRTPAVVTQRTVIRDAFIEVADRHLNTFLGREELNEADRATFNLPPAEIHHSKRGKITDTPVTQVSSDSIATVTCRVRTTHDSTRYSMHPLADAVEVRYVILPVTEGVVPPNDVAQCRQFFISKKAIFSIELTQADSAKRFYCFLRWVNLSNPANNGSWTEIFTTVVR